MVVPVPTTVPVERYDEERRPLQSVEPRCRLTRRPRRRRTAARTSTRESTTGSGSRCRPDRAGEVLEAEVVRHEPVLTGELGHRAATSGAVAEDEPCEMKAGRPPRALPELRGVRLVELRADDAEESLRVTPAEREAPRRPPRAPGPRCATGRSAARAACGPRARVSILPACAGRAWRAPRPMRRSEPRGHRRPRAGTARGPARGRTRAGEDRSGGAVVRMQSPRGPGRRATRSGSARRPRTEHRVAVVAVVQRHPRQRTVISLDPLRQQRRLSVAGGRDERDETVVARGAEAIDQPGPQDCSRPHMRNHGLRATSTGSGAGRLPLDEAQAFAPLGSLALSSCDRSDTSPTIGRLAPRRRPLGQPRVKRPGTDETMTLAPNLSVVHARRPCTCDPQGGQRVGARPPRRGRAGPPSRACSPIRRRRVEASGRSS